MTKYTTEQIAAILELLPPSPWTWDSGYLRAADGTIILWAVSDSFGKKYIGVQADCDDFIANAPDIISHLVADNDALREERDRAINAADEYRNHSR